MWKGSSLFSELWWRGGVTGGVQAASTGEGPVTEAAGTCEDSQSAPGRGGFELNKLRQRRGKQISKGTQYCAGLRVGTQEMFEWMNEQVNDSVREGLSEGMKGKTREKADMWQSMCLTYRPKAASFRTWSQYYLFNLDLSPCRSLVGISLILLCPGTYPLCLYHQHWISKLPRTETTSRTLSQDPVCPSTSMPPHQLQPDAAVQDFWLKSWSSYPSTAHSGWRGLSGLDCSSKKVRAPHCGPWVPSGSLRPSSPVCLCYCRWGRTPHPSLPSPNATLTCPQWPTSQSRMCTHSRDHFINAVLSYSSVSSRGRVCICFRSRIWHKIAAEWLFVEWKEMASSFQLYIFKDCSHSSSGLPAPHILPQMRT